MHLVLRMYDEALGDPVVASARSDAPVTRIMSAVSGSTTLCQGGSLYGFSNRA